MCGRQKSLQTHSDGKRSDSGVYARYIYQISLPAAIFSPKWFVGCYSTHWMQSNEDKSNRA